MNESLELRFAPLPSGTRLSERSARALIKHTLIHAERLTRQLLTDFNAVLQALAFPIITLIMLNIVLGRTVSSVSGHPAIYGTTAMMMVIGSMAATTASAYRLSFDANNGLVTRFQTMPLNRVSPIFGRMASEALRNAATSIIILAVGYCLGLRLHEGWVAVPALLLVPILIGGAYGLAMATLTTFATGIGFIQIASIATTLMMFFNTGYVPLAAYPKWLQPIVEHQPISVAVSTIKGLTLGGPVLSPGIEVVCWAVGLTALLLYPAMLGYRRAALRSR